MESLLSPSESNAFQSFLSSMSHDWNVDIQVPNDKLALAKATKDLMALDPHNWVSNQHIYQQQDLFLPFINTRLPNSQQQPHLFLPHPPPSDSSSRTPTPTSASPFSFPSSQSSRSSDSSIGKQSKRPRPHPHPYDVSDSLSHSISRIRRSYSDSIQLISPSSSIPSHPSSKPPPKPALLTASQKKANHIQSEQKRRANIRRGYDALCECVPALREAIREEEEAAAAERSDSTGVPGQYSKVRKGKAAIKGKDGDERIDGRAGPRSENIVLSKTIEYVNELLDQRSALLARLHRARTTLPPGHPALVVPPQKRSSRDVHIVPPGQEEEEEDEGPLWEREWQGGLGKLGDMGDAAMDDGDEST